MIKSESLEAGDPKAVFDYFHPNHIWEASNIQIWRKPENKNNASFLLLLLLQKLSESQVTNFKIQNSKKET